MIPILADAIDIPLVLGLGIAVLVPLLAFQVVVEAAVLRGIWHQPFKELSRFAFGANCWSLVAGIPTKILNAVIYNFILPDELSRFFTAYPSAVALGTLVYFVVTLGVEGFYARRWNRTARLSIGAGRTWAGILLANLATYMVLAPLHYFATRPIHPIRQFTPSSEWTSHSDVQVIYADSETGELRAQRLGASISETIVPVAVKEYLVSADLNLCLFRGTDGSLYSYSRSSGESNLVWHTQERFHMEQVAFSPTGRLFAFASEEDDSVTIFDSRSAARASRPLPGKGDASDLTLVWSTEETHFYISGLTKSDILRVGIGQDLSMQFERTKTADAIDLLECYGRVGGGYWGGGGDWGRSYSDDTCGDLKVWAAPGLGSGLRVYRADGQREPLLSFSVGSGLLHIARFSFRDVAFLEQCEECLFQASGYVYLLDIPGRRVGTVTRGERFILLTERYRKSLVPR